MVFVDLMVMWINLCLHSLPVMNHKQNKNTSFKNLELSLTRTCEAPFNIILMDIPALRIFIYKIYCLVFCSLKPCCSRSLYHQRLFSCQMETRRASAIYSVHLHFFQLTTLATLSLYGCLGDCYLNKEHSFFLLLLLIKKKSFHKSGRRRKKIKLKQHNYITLSSILSTRWEGEPQRKPPLLLGVTSGERDAWNSNSGRARDTPV